MALKNKNKKQNPAGTMLRQHHMLKGVLNSEGKGARACLFICFVCLEPTREEAGGREKKEPKYIYILNSINKSQFVCEGARGGGRGVSYVL